MFRLFTGKKNLYTKYCFRSKSNLSPTSCDHSFFRSVSNLSLSVGFYCRSTANFIIAAFWPDVAATSWPVFWRHIFAGGRGEALNRRCFACWTDTNPNWSLIIPIWPLTSFFWHCWNFVAECVYRTKSWWKSW